MSPSTEPVGSSSTFSVAGTSSKTAPLIVIAFAVRSALTAAPGPIVRLWLPSSMDPSTPPSIVRSSLLMMRPSTRRAFPTQAATRRSVKVVSSAIRNYGRRHALTAIKPQQRIRRLGRSRGGGGQECVGMRHRVVGLALVIAAGTSGAAVRGQGGEAGFLRRNFSPVAYLKASNPRADAKLGFGSALTGRTLAMSRDGNTLAVAAPDESSAATGINGNQRDDSAGGAGAVYVFTRAGAGRPWAQEAYLKASNTDAYDSFGFSLAISANGNTLAVTATREDSSARGVNGNQADNSAEDSGAVYVFARAGGRWAQQAYVKSSNADAGDQFGWSVALSDDGNVMAVGASTEASNARGINGNEADNSAANAGAVYVFTRAGAAWSQQSYLKGEQTDAGDLFGFCVDLSGDGGTLAICGYDEDGGIPGVNGNQADNSKGGSGCAYIFVRDRSTPVGAGGAARDQTTYLKQANLNHNQDAFGSAIALSGDGRTLAVDAADEAGTTGGINGAQYGGEQIGDNSNGALYVFVNTNGSWS